MVGYIRDDDGCLFHGKSKKIYLIIHWRVWKKNTILLEIITLTAQTLAQAPPAMQKQMLGEKLYPAVSRLQPELAGKITGMMLEMENQEVLMMLDSEQQLRQKVEEAVRVLNQMK